MLFQQLDTVIAFAGVMLLLSLMITTAVQAVASILGLRGRNLAWGVERLLHQIAPEQTEATREHAKKLAGEILNHEVLADGKSFLRKLAGNGRWGPTRIKREQILLLIDELRSGGGEDIKNSIEQVLPAAAAEKLDQTQAKLTDYAARTEAWYESVMDAATDRFKLWSRWWTAAFALLVAFGLQVDSTDILRQLSSSNTRAQVLGQIDGIDEIHASLYQDALSDAQDTTEDASKQKLLALEKAGQSINDSLQASGLTLFRAGEGSEEMAARRFFGMLMTALLLSLGAPFWYGTIGKLVGFRSALTGETDKKSDPSGGGD